MEDNKQLAKTNALPWILLVVAAFIIGSMWTKLQTLQKGGTGGTVAGTQANTGSAAEVKASPLAPDNLKAYAKELKLDTKKFDTCFTNKTYASAVKKETDEGTSVGVGGTPAFFVNGYLINGAQPFDNFKKVIDYLLTGGTLESKTLPAGLDTLVKQGAVNTEKKVVDIGNSPSRGNADAKITIVEFSDFECPFCQRSYRTVKQVEETYGKDVRIIYKNFPLVQIHPHAQDAAEAASCAHEQGKFWEYHDKLFEVQGA